MTLIAATALPGAGDPAPLAAAVGIAIARREADSARGVVLVEVGRPGLRRPTLLSSAAARELERRLTAESASARGALCWCSVPEHDDLEGILGRCLAVDPRAAIVVLDPGGWRALLDSAPAGLRAALVAAALPRQRAQAAIIAADAIATGLRVAVVGRRPGRVGARRALAGIDPGGELGVRAHRLAARLADRPGPRASPPVVRPRGTGTTRAPAPRAGEAGQALPLVLGAALLAVVAGLALALVGAGATGGARLQRAADLAAVSAARSLRDDHPRLFVSRRLQSGRANPDHLAEGEYRRRARAAARDAAARNGFVHATVTVGFPGSGFAPTRVRVALRARPGVAGATGSAVQAIAVAEAHPAVSSPPAAPTAAAGGYAGPLAHRQGEPMRPDVARAFDSLAGAARAAGHSLVINSAFRSDAEQAALYAANPDPRWVAPPGTSLHRCATELDLGPASAYGWLANHAPRFGFLRRYDWEPWHYGFTGGPPPCSRAGNQLAAAGDGEGAGNALPAFVPARYRRPIAAAATRWNVPVSLLAAQLLAESNFNPFAVSPAGAQGIAQFMPGTAAAYGLADPFDPDAAIRAQARLMADLLREFQGATELALAAYNAGPAAVAACDCVPPYPETRAYVARILGLLGGAGVAAPPELEVRLVR